ncbi:cation-translocating P-type ATPase [Vaccinium witches'-broom phytoplasma]|uniref:cation-translocating P-type ATPase n=1 Tax=Vaccinium witches'-broom phytoplasma TaxID=85642 RepID=UPI00037067D0|nr:cation-transporting P-type ATPase [Vaccinium witches'-broom phytoplasma]
MESLFYQLNLKKLEKALNTDFAKGLDNTKVQQKRLKDGFNRLQEPVAVSFWKTFRKQFNDLFVYLLLIASAISFVMGFISHQKEEILEGILILIIVLINAFLGVIYENKTQKSLLMVKNKTKPYSKVLRNNQKQLISQEELVVGDIVFLETGDIVPADIRLIQSNHLKINESVLTGETLSVAKKHQDNDPPFNLFNAFNIVFMSTVVVYGNAKGVVLATGMNTQIGKITQFTLIKKTTKTPLEKNIAHLSKLLSVIIAFLIIINFSLNLLKHYWFGKKIDLTVLKHFLFSSIALAVAVIPEGLLAIITIIMILGIKKLANQKAIVKNLKTLEILGTVSVICTDKTGTLTYNKMNIKHLYTSNKVFSVNSALPFPKDVLRLVQYGCLCNNANTQKDQNNKINNIISDPVDQSFIDLAHLWQIDVNLLREENIRLKEFPFDDKHKLMITIHRLKSRKYIIIKGAGEIICNLSNYVDCRGEMQEKQLNNEHLINNELTRMTQKGYKVLGVAYVDFFQEEWLQEDIALDELLSQLQNKIVFLGLVAIQDPIRPEIFAAIQDCRNASIIPIMITGDHLYTAEKIAKELQILKHPHDLAINGDMLEQMSESEMNTKLPYIKVYARTKPEQKLKIVQYWQKLGHIVAMTGDGVNDAPSIKQADIGISMGVNGTEITKQTADIVLTDDNFNTIKNAIEEGRNIFLNIKKSILFLLSCNMGEITVILLNTCLGHFFFTYDFVILSALQILWINLVTDSLVALGLGMEPKEKELMNQKPRNIKKALLTPTLFYKIALEGFFLGLLTFLAAWIGYKLHPQEAAKYGQTFAFFALSLSQLVHVFNLRHLHKSVFSLQTNWALIKFFLISVFLQMIILFVPFLKENFQLADLSCRDFLIIFMLSMSPLLVVEIAKKVLKRKIND